MNSSIILILTLASLNSFSRERITVKIPFKEREMILLRMRGYLNLTEKLIRATTDSRFNDIERLSSNFMLDEFKLNQLGFRENRILMDLALKFYSKSGPNIYEAAKSKNQNRVFKEIANMMQRCNRCHEVVQVVEWPSKDYPPPTKVKLEFPKDYDYKKWTALKKKLESNSRNMNSSMVFDMDM